MNTQPISCKVCDAGQLVGARIHRHSTALVAVGWLMVSPFLLGVISVALGAAMSLLPDPSLDYPETARSPREIAVAALEERGLDAEGIEVYLADPNAALPVGWDETEELAGIQYEYFSTMEAHAKMERKVEVRKQANPAAAVIGGGMGLMLLGVIPALIGAIFASKRNVLVCNHCGAVTARA